MSGIVLFEHETFAEIYSSGMVIWIIGLLFMGARTTDFKLVLYHVAILPLRSFSNLQDDDAVGLLACAACQFSQCLMLP